ncbi:MAG TPA: DUF1579 family protein [Tepidisphaeraceae bacterium]|jgi:hypothetical protein
MALRALGLPKLLLVVSALLLTFTSFANAQPATQPSAADAKRRFLDAAQKASAPTEQHKLLNTFVGEFDQMTEVRLGRSDPMKFHSTAKGKAIMDGRFVQFESNAAPEEPAPSERIVMYGYDPAAGKFTLWNIESMSLTAATATGEYDAATKTFTFNGERDAPGMPGRQPFRWVIQVKPDASLSQDILIKPPGSEQFVPVVHVEHKRTGK